MPWHRGLTLIEVLASTTLLALLLAATALAYSEHAQQIRQAQRRLEAIEQADRLLAQWYSEPTGVPPEEEGELDGQLVWRTSVLEQAAAQSLGCEVVRVEMFGSKESDSDQALVTVDVVVVADEQQTSSAKGAAGRTASADDR